MKLKPTRQPMYETRKGEARVYIHDEPTGKMQFSSSHTTYQMARDEAIQVLRSGYTDKVVVHTGMQSYTFTSGYEAGSYRKSVYRDGVKIA